MGLFDEISLQKDILYPLAVGLLGALISLVGKKAYAKIINRIQSQKARIILRDHRTIITLQVGVLILIATGTIWWVRSTLSSLFIVILILIICTAILLKELRQFWRIGLHFIEPSIAIDTYVKTFNLAHISFFLLGTNAHRFCQEKAFEDMAKRIRQSRGRMQLLLAHPDSYALVVAARNRNMPEQAYQTQARIALGKILQMKNRLNLYLEIHLYHADNIEDLPIFRAMYVNEKYCVASIAVYGRGDQGRTMPQMHIKSDERERNVHKSMYSVLHRYYCFLWERSLKLSATDEAYFISSAEKPEPLIRATRAPQHHPPEKD